MPVVFLDRDGVINENREDYVRSVDDLVFLPGAFEALAQLKRPGFISILVSNQAGVGRGLIPPDELECIDRKLVREIALNGGEIVASYYCTHRQDEGCDCRKPETGLLETASFQLGFDLEGSYIIGDGLTDIQAGHRAGCTTILVLTGRTSTEELYQWPCKPDFVASDLPTAADWILKQESRVTNIRSKYPYMKSAA